MDLFSVSPTMASTLLYYAYVIVRLYRKSCLIIVTSTSAVEYGLRARITEASRGIKLRAT